MAARKFGTVNADALAKVRGARALEKERRRQRSAPPPTDETHDAEVLSVQLKTLIAHIRHYAIGSKVDPDTLTRGLALLCLQQKEPNPVVALEKHFDVLLGRAYTNAAKGKG